MAGKKGCGPPRKLTPAWEDRVVQWYMEGLSCADISKKFGIASQETVRRALKRRGVDMRREPTARQKAKLSKLNKGKKKGPFSTEHRLNISKAKRAQNLRGPRNPLWKGNDRKRMDLKDLKKAVHSRDRQCRICGSKKNRQAHHIFSWAFYPDLRFDVGNAIELCVLCHKDLHSYCGSYRVDMAKQAEWLLERLGAPKGPKLVSATEDVVGRWS